MVIWYTYVYLRQETNSNRRLLRGMLWGNVYLWPADTLAANLRQIEACEVGRTLKKIKFGTIETMGYLGILIWVSVIVLRGLHLSTNATYQFFLGILPNVGAAWLMTMLGKWFILFVLKQRLTIAKHVLLCTGVFILALASEIFHDLFLNSPFDPYDILVTAVAQLLILLLPILTKDKYLSGYTQESDKG